jgi:hypothetical protein
MPHTHVPVVRLSVAVCPNDDPPELLVDVDVGEAPPPGWTADEIAAAVLVALDSRLAAALDGAWRRHAAARN